MILRTWVCDPQKGQHMYSAMFCFCFSSTENPPLGMLTEARLNLETRSGKKQGNPIESLEEMEQREEENLPSQLHAR